MNAFLPRQRTGLKSSHRMGRCRRLLVVLTSVPLTLIIFFSVVMSLISFSPEDLRISDDLILTDRQGETLRHIPGRTGERHLWTPSDEIPPALWQAFLAAEDKRFFDHPGFDARAIVRAVIANCRSGRVVSGASTITQQLVRLTYPRQRTYSAKFVEIVRAAKAERILSKETILENYLNRVPMGNNVIGIGLASRMYFGRKPMDLDAAECALLASLPKAPTTLNPYAENTERLKVRRDWVLGQMQASGWLSDEQRRQAAERPISVRPKSFCFRAPHFVDYVIANLGRSQKTGLTGTVRTTLDLEKQTRLERILQSHRHRLLEHGCSQAGALIVHNPTMDVLALAGSLEYSERDLGFNNAVTALRCPGSTLKPFLYAHALDSGFTVSTLLGDKERGYRSPTGAYFPKNFDRCEYGPVTFRTALANSLNLSSVELLRMVGQESFFGFLKDMALVNDPNSSAERYGLGLVVGNMEVTLEQLVRAYTVFARQGILSPLRILANGEPSSSQQVLSPESGYIITDILSDPSARSLTFGTLLDFPYSVAWKTGTSVRYRDSWIVGFTPDYTVGVWAGNFDGSPTSNLSGVSGAGQIFQDIIRDIYRDGFPGTFTAPQSLQRVQVCGHSGMKPSPHCRHLKLEWFTQSTAPEQECRFHTESGDSHQLAAPFAAWLHDRTRLGQSSTYQLAGFEQRSGESLLDDSEDFFRNAGQAITVRNQDAMTQIPQSSDQNPSRVSIGLEPPLAEPDASVQASAIRIISPLDGDRFLLSQNPDRHVVNFQAEVAEAIGSVTWYVNGVQYAQVGPPYRTRWNLQKGRHRIAAVTSESVGDEIVVTVE